MAVHRVELPLRSAKVYSKYRDNPEFKLHLKCPNCYHFKKVTRHADDSGIALIGDPRTTGSLDDADAMGYPDHHYGPGRVDPPEDDDAEAEKDEESADAPESESSDEEVADDSDENEASDEAPDGDEGDDEGNTSPGDSPADTSPGSAGDDDESDDGGEDTVTDADADGGDDA